MNTGLKLVDTGGAHGATRADTPERKAKRRQFIQELQVALPIHLITATLGETYVAVC
jgi:hypothetical protein